jgi:hypothetical protein
MIAIKNPYTPGAGLKPPYLAGREDAMRKVRQSQQAIESGAGVNPIVITGLRGMGKTALLGHIGDFLAPEGWFVLPVARFGRVSSLSSLWGRLREDIISRQPRELISAKSKKFKTESLTWKAGGGIGPVGPSVTGEVVGKLVANNAQTLNQEGVYDELFRLGEKAMNLKQPLLLLFDEVQEANSEELAILAEFGQLAGERGWPIMIILAGLDPLKTRLAEAGTFAIRFPSVPANPLSEEESGLALTRPAKELGVTYDQDALDMAIEFSQGIPYHLQMIGQHNWEAKTSQNIKKKDVKKAIPLAQAELEETMYKPLWEKASIKEQQYLMAMASMSKHSVGISTNLINESLGKKHRSVTFLRQRLIDKGLIHATRYGILEFSYPNFGLYINKIHGLQVEEEGTLPSTLL